MRLVAILLAVSLVAMLVMGDVFQASRAAPRAAAAAAVVGGGCGIFGCSLKMTILSAFTAMGLETLRTYLEGMWTIPTGGFLYCPTISPSWSKGPSTSWNLLEMLDPFGSYFTCHPPTEPFWVRDRWGYKIKGTIVTNDTFFVNVDLAVHVLAGDATLRKSPERLVRGCLSDGEDIMQCLVGKHLQICFEDYVYRKVNVSEMQHPYFFTKVRNALNRCFELNASPYKITGVTMNPVRAYDIRPAVLPKNSAWASASAPDLVNDAPTVKPTPSMPPRMWSPPPQSKPRKPVGLLPSLLPPSWRSTASDWSEWLWLPITVLSTALVVCWVQCCLCRRAPPRRAPPQEQPPPQAVFPPQEEVDDTDLLRRIAQVLVQRQPAATVVGAPGAPP